jgi:hypothetical protein
VAEVVEEAVEEQERAKEAPRNLPWINHDERLSLIFQSMLMREYV